MHGKYRNQMAINDEKIKKERKKERNEEFEVEEPSRVRCRREEIVVTNTMSSQLMPSR